MAQTEQAFKALYAEPRDVAGLEECYFYHSMEIPGYGFVRGPWDHRGAVDAYLGDVGLQGKRVLEVGTASGFFCFEMEKRGADVVAYDLSDEHSWDVVPYAQYDHESFDAERRAHLRQINNAWWLAHRAHDSRARVVYGTVYEIPEEIGRVEVATFGNVLRHVRDPFLALEKALRLTTETAIVTENPSLRYSLPQMVMEPLKPSMAFLPNHEKVQPRESWWHFTPGIIKRMLGVLGFEDTAVNYHLHRFPAHAALHRRRPQNQAAARLTSLVPAMRVLLVTMYFPPAGGAGVARPTKTAGQLAELGFDVHVLAPDDSKWIARDEEAAVPDNVTVHRARYLGPRGRLPAEELHGLEGADRLLKQAALFSRRVLVPDEFVTWGATAIPAARKIVRDHDVDVLLTTSPPPSINLIGAAVKQISGVPWVADLRDSVAANPDRRIESPVVRLKERGQRLVAQLVARWADAVVGVTPTIVEEMRELGAQRAEVIPNGADFEDFEGLAYRPGERFRITHTGTFFGKRDPKPFLEALARLGPDVVVRFVGGLRAADREWAEQRGLTGRVEVLPHVPRRRALELQRDSEALLLLLPEAGGRGKSVPSGKIFEYLAAERPILAAVPPDGAAAQLVREAGAGVVVPPDDVDSIAAALEGLVKRWRAGALDGAPLRPDLRARLSRRARTRELAELLESVA